jgi:hypothetical protein
MEERLLLPISLGHCADHQSVHRPRGRHGWARKNPPSSSTPRPEASRDFTWHGGIGKTQLAVEFARKHQREYLSVLFVDADSKDSLLQSFLAIFRRITEGNRSREDRSPYSAAQLEEIAKRVLTWFDPEGNDRWLLIFNNVDRAPSDTGGFDIQAFFPSRDVGSILVTTRLASLPVSGHRRSLSPMNLEQSSMLLRSYRLGPISANAETKLLDSLAGLPLALSQAGRFINTL